MNSSLFIQDYAIFPRLGVGEVERAHPQKVLISLRIDFTEIPAASRTDSIDDTFCYEKMTSLMTTSAGEREFKTIEFLARELSRVAAMSLEGSSQSWSAIWFRIHKVNAPIRHLEGGTAFELTLNRKDTP